MVGEHAARECLTLDLPDDLAACRGFKSEL